MPVTYFVRMTAKDGQEDAVRDLLLSNVRRIQEGERGNLAFAVHRELEDPRTFWLYEVWTDFSREAKALLEIYLGHGSVRIPDRATVSLDLSQH